MPENKKREKLKVKDTAYIGLSIALIAICSWITIPLYVPITLQTMSVCLISALFGAKRSTLSILLYILLGAAGVPVFHNFTSGIGVVLGPTGGYMAGFIFTAIIVGIASKKSNKLWVLILSMTAGILVCYAFGTVWFAIVYAKSNEPAPLLSILGWCVFPFLIPDAVKIIIASLLAKRLKKYIK